MHFDLRRRTESVVCLKNPTIRVHLTNIVRGHESFGHAGRSAQVLIVIDLHRDVAVVGGHHASVIDPLADVTNLFLISYSEPFFIIPFTLFHKVYRWEWELQRKRTMLSVENNKKADAKSVLFGKNSKRKTGKPKAFSNAK